MDETTTVGTAIAELIAAGIPLGALSNGPRIPEDLAVADAASVCARLLAAVPPAIRTTSGEQQHAA
jgi:flagellar biosynthesis GTPase FlhF